MRGLFIILLSIFVGAGLGHTNLPGPIAIIIGVAISIGLFVMLPNS